MPTFTESQDHKAELSFLDVVLLLKSRLATYMSLVLSSFEVMKRSNDGPEQSSEGVKLKAEPHPAAGLTRPPYMSLTPNG